MLTMESGLKREKAFDALVNLHQEQTANEQAEAIKKSRTAEVKFVREGIDICQDL